MNCADRDHNPSNYFGELIIGELTILSMDRIFKMAIFWKIFEVLAD